jgi:hypothetical protein
MLSQYEWRENKKGIRAFWFPTYAHVYATAAKYKPCAQAKPNHFTQSMV